MNRSFVDIYGGPDEQRLIRRVCTNWPNLRPLEVARMPWHERWFYLDWLRDEAAEAEHAQLAEAFAAGPFDPRKPQTGDAATFDFGALGAGMTQV